MGSICLLLPLLSIRSFRSRHRPSVLDGSYARGSAWGLADRPPSSNRQSPRPPRTTAALISPGNRFRSPARRTTCPTPRPLRPDASEISPTPPRICPTPRQLPPAPPRISPAPRRLCPPPATDMPTRATDMPTTRDGHAQRCARDGQHRVRYALHRENYGGSCRQLSPTPPSNKGMRAGNGNPRGRHLSAMGTKATRESEVGRGEQGPGLDAAEASRGRERRAPRDVRVAVAAVAKARRSLSHAAQPSSSPLSA